MADNADVSRRRFLQTAAGGTAVAAATGTAAAQEGNETAGNETSGNETAGNETSGGGGGGGGEQAGPPDLGGYLDDANLYEGEVADETGSDTVTVQVGAGSSGLAFDPPAVHVDNGATVQWEWTGEGGAHNVVSDDDVFESGDPVDTTGVQFEYTFEEDGIYNYYCMPHEASGMLGSIVVGTDYPTKSTGGGGGGGGVPSIPGPAKSIGVATAFVMSASLGLAYFFMKYGGDYETPS
ncbi:halocyanin domain-containing protein [Halorientalis salina]|uniref:halocyanin domain-containing protein n=1 Tax=Halorientalis salina TaxID=2932266 RepID=UPI0010ABCD56|nr:halocyanin domain-containing protein [Halorientalis salina]